VLLEAAPKNALETPLLILVVESGKDGDADFSIVESELKQKAGVSRRLRHGLGAVRAETATLRLQHYLNAAVLLVAKGLVRCGGVVKLDPMRNDEGGVDLSGLNLV
jgi:hypothetical protein